MNLIKGLKLRRNCVGQNLAIEFTTTLTADIHNFAVKKNFLAQHRFKKTKNYPTTYLTPMTSTEIPTASKVVILPSTTTDSVTPSVMRKSFRRKPISGRLVDDTPLYNPTRHII